MYIVRENLFKDQIIFPRMMIVLLILITFSQVYVLVLSGEA